MLLCVLSAEDRRERAVSPTFCFDLEGFSEVLKRPFLVCKIWMFDLFSVVKIGYINQDTIGRFESRVERSIFKQITSESKKV